MTQRKRAPKTNYATELVTHDGVTRTLRAWADTLNINYRAFSIRYARGLRCDELFQPLQPYNGYYLTVNGETHTVNEWAEITKLPRDVIKMRAVRGWDDTRIFQPLPKRAPRSSKPTIDLRQQLKNSIEASRKKDGQLP
jgi:hypothetical protein